MSVRQEAQEQTTAEPGMTGFEETIISAAGRHAGSGQPQRAHYQPVRGGQQMRVIFEPAADGPRQAVFLRATVPFLIAGQRIEGRPVALWRHKAPELVVLTFLEAGELMVKSVWAGEDGIPESAHQGGALMIVDEVPDGFRYRCCDDDLGGVDELVFRVEKVDLKQAASA